MDDTYSTLLVDLDSILDTRFGLLASIDTTYAENAIKAGYHQRTVDDFPDVPFETFESLYRDRTKLALEKTRITPIALMVNDFVNKTIDMSLNSPYKMLPRVMINVHPYELSPEEETLIIQGLIGVVDQRADIQLVSYSVEKIHPLFVKRYLSMMIMYRYDEWLKIHAYGDGFKKVNCSDIGLIGPEISFIKNEQDVKENPYRAAEFMFQPIIGLKLIPVNNFSILLNQHK